VAVVEARQVGAGTTGHSTAKVSVLQGSRLSSIRRRHSAAIGRQYVEANIEGQQWLRRYCESHHIPIQARSAYTYATTPDGLGSARSELTAAQEAGLAARWVTETELPFPVLGAVELTDQFQIDPLDVLCEMARDLIDRGGHLFVGERVRAVRPGERVTVRTDSATMHAGTVVLATGVPIMDRGGFWGRLQPLRSYAAAFRIPGPVSTGHRSSRPASPVAGLERQAPGNASCVGSA
jgi:glycine/D-amino acid oxidase-like deaminating enzyme